MFLISDSGDEYLQIILCAVRLDFYLKGETLLGVSIL